MEARIGFDEDT